ncbi:MAG: AraC family transcriptional regulator [Candidatus Marinimicrobia bacterium]|nr:AraC family transcriptional regulator [Candidatus Neomarinimicrobiota bacterium]MCF7829142.1 AraC family transcriptional regulator [Candidatus Neomarinimicrobiota bacterium]MCF7881205.1 AraC family transcriptional regulator [Candidatus Neomarinimicrobiota bacterium]
MVQPKQEEPRGILNEAKGLEHFRLYRYLPSPELSPFVENYWSVQWDLRGNEPFTQDVLSHPSIDLVFERGNTWIWGVVTGKFTRVIEGKGKVLGVKFCPGGFYPFYGKPVASFTDDVLPFREAFDEDLASLESSILSIGETAQMAEAGESFLMRHFPEGDPKAIAAGRIVAQIQEDTSILRVEDLAEKVNRSTRTLQRQFRRYIGVSPKWVIQRYRLHEAAEKMANGRADHWPALAVDLGYFDQAHFIRDFKTIVGQTPAEYAKTL